MKNNQYELKNGTSQEGGFKQENSRVSEYMIIFKNSYSDITPYPIYPLEFMGATLLKQNIIELNSL